MRIGITGRAFTDRPSLTIIAFLLKFMMILIPCNYSLLHANGTPIVNIDVVGQSPATSSARLAIFSVVGKSLNMFSSKANYEQANTIS